MKDRDIKLLIGLGIIAVLVLPYVLLVMPKNDAIAALETEITTLDERYKHLSELNNQRQFYNDEIARMEAEKIDIFSKFAPGIRKENTLMFLIDAEGSMPLDMDMNAMEFEAGPTTKISEPTGEGDTAKPAVEAICAISNVKFGGTYEGVKKMLGHVLNYNERMVISSMDISYDPQYANLKGVFSLKQYAITGQEGKELPPAEIPEITRGEKNIFIPATEGAENIPVEGNDYGCDYYMLLRSYGTEGGTKVIGKSGDGSGETNIINSSNSVQSMKIMFREEDGKYYASYVIGTVKYPIENFDLGEEFTVEDGVINFRIISSNREEKDNVGANIKFINETSIPLVVSVSGDDAEKPRVNITEKTGNVTVEQ